MTTVGKASIKFEADVGQVSDTLVAKMEQALSKIDQILAKLSSNVTTSAKAAGDAVGKNVEDGAKKADRAVSDVGKDGFDAVEKASRTAADTVAKSFEEGSSKAGSALGKVDGSSFDKAASAAASAASTIESRVSGAATTAASALDKVDGSTLDKAAASASAAASTIESRVPPAASRAGEAMRKAGRDGEGGFEGARSSAGLLTGALGKVAVAAAALAGPATIVQKGWARLTSIDEARAKLGALGHDADVIETIMDNAMSSVTDTAFGFGDAAGQAATLVAAGIKPGEDLERVLGLVADSAAVAGVDLNEMGSIFGKVAASGKMQGDTMEMLLDRQIGLLPVLAKQYGVTGEEMSKLISEGKVGFEDFAEAMESMMGGGAQKMGGTVTASFQNVGAAAGRLGAQLLGAVFQAAPGFLGGVQKGLGWATDQLKLFQTWMDEGSLAAELLRVALIAVGSSAVIGAIVGTVGQLSSMARVTGMVQRGAQMMNLAFLASPWGLAIIGITALVAGFVMLWNHSEAFRGFWIGLWDSMKAAVEPVVDWIAGAFELLKGAWGDLVSTFTSDSAVEGDGPLGRLIGTESAGLILGTLQTVKGAWNELTEAFRGGDWGYGALSELIGLDNAETVVNAVAKVGEVLRDLPDLARGVSDVLFRGDYTGLPFGLEEDSVVVGILFAMRDAVLGVWEALQDLWGTLTEVAGVLADSAWSAASAIFESLWTVVKSLWDVFSSVAGAVWELIQALAPVLLPILKLVGGIIAGVVVGAFFALMGALQVVVKLIEAVAKVIGWLAQNILVPLVEVIALVVSWLVEKLGGALSWVADLLGSAFSAVGPALESLWQGIQDGWNGFTSWLGAAWSGLQTIWSTYGQPVVDFVVAAFSFLWEGVQLHFRLLGAAWEVFTTALGKAWEAWGQPVIDWVAGAFENLWEKLQIVFGWVKVGWEFLWAGIQAAWQIFGQPVVDLVVWVFENAWAGLQIIFGLIQSGWDLLWSGIRWVYDTVIAPVVAWITAKFGELQWKIDAALALIRFSIDAAGQKIRGLWDEYVQPMIDWVIAGFNRLSDTIKGWKDNVIGWFADAGSWLVDAGKNIIQGLIDGATSLLSRIGEFFLDVLPDWVKDPFKKALGIHSPSRVFGEYGANIGQGLVVGIESMRGGVQAATSGLAGMAADVTLPTTTVGVPVVGSPTAPTDAGWGAMGASLDATTTGVIDPMLTSLTAGVQSTAAEFATQATGTIIPAWTTMSTALTTAKTTLVDPALAGISAGVLALGRTFPAQVLGSIVPAWSGMGSQIMAVKTSAIDPAFSGIQSGMQTMVGAFANGARDVGLHMNQMRDNAAVPIRYTISSIFNDGVVGMWNSASDLLGTSRMSPHPIRFATGGIMPGFTPGRDVHRFISPTGGVLDLSGGEPVMRPEFGRVVGSDWVDGVNAAARVGGVTGVQKFLGNAGGSYLGGFNTGGVIGSITGLVNRFFPGMTITSTLRPGDPGYHGRGMAVDFSDGYDTTPGMQAAARFFHQNYGRGLAELIHWPLSGWQNIKNGQPLNYGGATNSQHRNHVHVASTRPLPAPGNVTESFDGAGWDIDVDWVSAFAGEAEQALKNAIANAPTLGGMVDQWPPKIGEKLHEATRTKMESEFDRVFSMAGVGGGNVEQWSPMVSALLRLYGHPESWLGNTLRRMNQESGGDPRAINLWDSNAAAGIPSKGLMQVIDPTFAAYRDPQFPDNIWDPRANIAASMRYAMSRYGSLPAAYDRAGGYHSGGLMGMGEGWFHKTAIEPERVLSPRQTRSFDDLVGWLTTTPEPEIRGQASGTGGSYGGVRREVHVTQNIHTSDPKTAGDQAADKLTALII